VLGLIYLAWLYLRKLKHNVVRNKFRCSHDGADPRALFQPVRPRSPIPSGFLAAPPRKIRDPNL